MKTAIQHLKISSAGFHNFAFFLLTFYFLKPINFRSPRGERSKINQFESIMQNKPNFRKAKMSASSALAEDYEKTGLSDKGKTKPIQTQFKPNTKPIKANTKPKQTQSNPISKAKNAVLRPRLFVQQLFAGSNLLFFSLTWPKLIPI